MLFMAQWSEWLRGLNNGKLLYFKVSYAVSVITVFTVCIRTDRPEQTVDPDKTS